MSVSPCEKSVHVAGVEPTIIEMKLAEQRSTSKKPMWVKCLHRKIHTHDVRALEMNSEGKLFSGGKSS